MYTNEATGRLRPLAVIATFAILFFIQLHTHSAAADEINGSIIDDNVGADARGSWNEHLDADGRRQPSEPYIPPKPSPYSYIWTSASQFTGCGSDLNPGSSWACTPHPDSCEAGSSNRIQGIGDALLIGGTQTSQTPVEGVTQQGTRVNNETGQEEDLGVRCALPGTPEFAEAPPVEITMTVSDFAKLPVQPLHPHAGPAEGWLPVNMVNVLYTEPSVQDLNTELLGTPVAVRATPTSYHWDLGDGNTITTTEPGDPYPSDTVSATYAHEGWYDITLTTTFAGQFSVDGGDWQDIDGTIEIASDPVPVFSKSLESRLVNSDVPLDEVEDPWIPERTPETEGPQDPHATHRKI